MPGIWLRSALCASLSVAIASVSGAAVAGNNGYFTTYNSKIERGELEFMLMNDLTQPAALRREQGQGDYLSHMVEIEYGLSDQFATEFMVEWFEDLENRQSHFGGFRWENRFRLFKKRVPLNPMIYMEYEDLDPRTRYKMEVSGWLLPPYQEATEGAPTRERILESRLVLSDMLGPLDLAFNAIFETDLSSGRTAIGYSAGVMWMPGHDGDEEADERAAPRPGAASYSCPMHADVSTPEPGACPKCGMALVPSRPKPGEHAQDAHGGMVGVGFEAYGGLGDTRAFGLRPARQEHYMGPILVYHPTARWMVHAQLGIGLSKVSDELVRLNIGYEF